MSGGEEKRRGGAAGSPTELGPVDRAAAEGAAAGGEVAGGAAAGGAAPAGAGDAATGGREVEGEDGSEDGRSEPTLRALQAKVRAFADARDWGRYHSPRNLAMALSVEAAELLELYLWSSDDGPQPPEPGRAPKVADEAADVLMCLLNFCDRAGVDLAAALEAKLEAAARKYPVERVRGRARKYDEYEEWEGPERNG